MSTRQETVLVLGVGNTLLQDEGIGVRVVEHLQALPAGETEGLKLLDGGTMGMTLLVVMEDADALIVVDAARIDGQPGDVKAFEGQDMDHFLRNRGRSPHDIGLDDLMDGLRLREAMPEQRALVGIEPEALTVGEDLTPDVAAKLPHAAQTVLDIVKRWRDG
ncbi:HyaD/HybD family hydrogenase maturation endopeptidase [Pseudomonadota bacterium]